MRSDALVVMLTLYLSTVAGCSGGADEKSAETGEDVAPPAELAALALAREQAICSAPDDRAVIAKSNKAVADTLAPPATWKDDGSVVDVLVVITALAEAEFKARGRDLAASLARATAQADSAFSNSGITLRVNIVHHQRVDYVEDTGPNGRSDLVRLEGADGQAIRNLRRLHKADVVTLIRSSKGGGNAARLLYSIATTPENIELRHGRAFSHINSTCVDESYRCFAHELGHLFGAGHNAEKRSPGLYSDSYGYHFPEHATNQTDHLCIFGTMQDYPCADQTRILHFSNPDISFQGHPTGVAGKADNARAINASKLFVTNYEQSSARTTTQ
jgi:hypothetical protein